MIVCHSRRFIFVHLHKTGGTSIKQAVGPLMDSNDVVIGDGSGTPVPVSSQPDPIWTLDKHSTATRIRNTVGAPVWDAYFKFAFVRHPFDRLVSLYEFFRRVCHNNQLQLAAGNVVRPEFAGKPPWNWLGMQAFLDSANFSEFIHSDLLARAQGAKPQMQSLADRNGELLVDYVGKFERLHDDWRLICQRLDIPNDLPHINQSARTHASLSSYWSPADVRFAEQKYQQDLEIFEYSTSEFLDPLS